jgi:hypothetical protein
MYNPIHFKAKRGVALKRADKGWSSDLFRASVLRDGLGALRYGVFSQLSREKKPHRSLDLSAGNGRSLVVVSQTRRLVGDAFEDVVDKAVHDRHGFATDAGIGVNLTQHFVNVDTVRFLSLLPPFLVGGRLFLSLCGLLNSFTRWFERHNES